MSQRQMTIRLKAITRTLGLFLILASSLNSFAQTALPPDDSESSPVVWEYDLTNSEVAELKTFRTYHRVYMESTTKHQFEIWYQVPGAFFEEDPRSGEVLGTTEWRRFHFAAQDLAEISQATQENHLSPHIISIGTLAPPHDLEELPEDISNFKEALVSMVERTLPDEEILDVKVGYLGYQARVGLKEYVPTQTFTGSQDRLGKIGEAYFWVDTQAQSITPFRGSLGVGWGLLRSFKPNVPNYSPRWIDVPLDTKIEGSSILALNSGSSPEGVHALHQIAYDQLLEAVLKATQKADQGLEFGVSLAEITETQSDTLLPEGIEPKLSMQLTVYPPSLPRQPGFGQETIHLDINFKVKGPRLVVSEVTHPNLPFKLELHSSFEQEGANLTLKAIPTSEEVLQQEFSQNLKLSTEVPYHLVQDEDIYLVNSSLVLDINTENLVVPLANGLSDYQVYIMDSIVPKLLVVPRLY